MAAGREVAKAVMKRVGITAVRVTEAEVRVEEARARAKAALVGAERAVAVVVVVQKKRERGKGRKGRKSRKTRLADQHPAPETSQFRPSGHGRSAGSAERRAQGSGSLGTTKDYDWTTVPF